MAKKIISLFIVLILIPKIIFAATTNQILTVTDKLIYIEKLLYGSEQKGALTIRLSKLEKDIFVNENLDSIVSRIDNIFLYIKENTLQRPSFITKLNTVEWFLNHSISNLPIKDRLESIEVMLFSKIQKGVYDERLAKVMLTALASGQTDLIPMKIPKDTLVKIKLINGLSSKNNHVNDIVTFVTIDNIFVEGQLVISKGTKGNGHIVKIIPSKNFGRDAEIQVNFDTVEGIDGTDIGIILCDCLKNDIKSLVTAAGISVAGMIILGPIGIVSGALVHGKNIEIKSNTELYVRIKTDTKIFGIRVS